MDMIQWPSRLIHRRLTWTGLPEYGWCRQVITTASPKSNICADTSGAGAEPWPVCFCKLRVAMRSALLNGWSLLEPSMTNSSATCGDQAEASWFVTPVSSACQEAIMACSASVFGLNGTVLQGFRQSFTPDPAALAACWPRE